MSTSQIHDRDSYGGEAVINVIVGGTGRILYGLGTGLAL